MNLPIERIPKAFRPAAVLAGVAIILAGLLATEGLLLRISQHTPPQTQAKPTTNAEPDIDQEDFQLPEEDEYDQMVTRPLFMERRKPGEAPAQAMEAAEKKPATPMTFKLMGIITTPTTQAALLIDAKGKYRRLKLQANLDGWELVELQRDKAVLEQNGKTETLALLKKRPPSPTAATAGKTPANAATKKAKDEDEEDVPEEEDNSDMEGTEDEDMVPSDEEVMNEGEETTSDE